MGKLLLFADEELERKRRRRDLVAPAKRSEAAFEKIASRTLEDGSPVHSFRTLLKDLATIVRNSCEARTTKSAATFTVPNPHQQRTLKLLESIAL